MQPNEFRELQPKVVLGVGAHPDDLDFSSSGTLAKFAAQGAAVHYLILTDGSKGSADLKASPEELIKTRQAEQQAAVKIIGGTDAHFLNYPDGGLEITLDLKKDIVKVIRELKPDVVITMDPSMIYSVKRGFINHPDHRAAGQATLDAVFPLARDHLSYPELYAEGYMPHKVATVLLTNFESSNFFVDISATMDTKINALRAHASQVPNIDEVEQRLRQMSSLLGGQSGCKYAEGFVRIDVRT